MTEFSAGISAEGGPAGITAGPDGNLWFTEAGRNRIGRITPAGVVTEFSAGISAKSVPGGITAGPDGNLWFTEFGGDRIGRITPVGIISELPPTAALLATRLRGTGAVVVRLRCPSGALSACRGGLLLTLRRPPKDPLGKTVGLRQFRVAPGRRAEVRVPLLPAGRRQLSARRKLPLSVWLFPSARSAAGLIQYDVVLKLS